MDMNGMWLPVVVAVLSAGLLYWHVQEVRKRPATTHDKLMGAIWAAMLVFGLGRVIYLVAGGGETGGTEPTLTAPAAPSEMPK